MNETLENRTERTDKKRIIKNIIIMLNCMDDSALSDIYKKIINTFLQIESDFDEGYIFALLQNNKIT